MPARPAGPRSCWSRPGRSSSCWGPGGPAGKQAEQPHGENFALAGHSQRVTEGGGYRARGARGMPVGKLAPPTPRSEGDPVYRPRNAFESADTVNRVVALLVRFPELHSIRSN